MSAEEAAVAVLLAIGVAFQLSSVLGILVARNVYDRLHFTGPASIYTPLALAAAIIIDFGPFSQAGLKAALTAVLVMGFGPALVHATARAAHIREQGRLSPSGVTERPPAPPAEPGGRG